MNKETVGKLLILLLFSYACIGSFGFSPYFIIACLLAFYAYDTIHYRKQLEEKNQNEIKELQKEIKTTTSDAHLKHKQLLTIISNMPFPLLLLDGDGKVVLYNNEFNALRHSERDIKMDFMNNDCKEPVAQFLKDAYIFEKQLVKEISLDGRGYEAISVPVMTNKKFSGCVILFQDITIAVERENMQKQFIADASHELKTPISVIKGMAEIMNEADFDDEKTEKEFLEQIEKEANRLDIVVRDLLQLSRLSSESLVLKRKFIDFNEIVENVKHTFVHMAGQKGIEIEVDACTDEKVFVDPDLTTTMLNNLVSNAIKYSDSGIVHIKTESDEMEYRVTVKDEGVGLSKADQEKIFERFYTVDKARSRANGGSGLGLPIVKSIVEAHGGFIEVDSILGGGTTFIVHFPHP